jgi:hypothetical protein
MKDLWERREEAIADARRRREEYWLEHDATNARLRRKMDDLLNSAMARLYAPGKEELTPDERLAMFVEILMEEFDKLGTPLPVPVARVGVSGVDRQAQKLLAERGVQRLQAATFDQYRRAVRDVIARLQSGTLAPYRWA